MSAIQQSSDTTNHKVSYMVISADDGILWAGVTATWSNTAGNSGTATLEYPIAEVTAGYIFSVVVPATADTCSINLIYDGHIIWTSPAVST